MKVLLASSSSGSQGGGEIYLLYLGRALRERGHGIVYWMSNADAMDALAGEASEIGEVVRSDYTNTYLRPMRSLESLWNHGVGRRVAAEWSALAPDVVHVNKQNLEDGLELLRAADATGIPSLATIHLTQSARFLGAKSAWLRDAVARRALRRYRGDFVVVQERRGDDLVEFLGGGWGSLGGGWGSYRMGGGWGSYRMGGGQPVGGAGRVHTVHNGVPVLERASLQEERREARRELEVADSLRLVLGLGRLMPQKRPEVWLDAALGIHRVHPDTRFVWVGSGWLDDRWARWVADRGLSGVVRHVPWTRRTRRYLAAADVFLHTAEYEGMPLALFEAMGAGLPCVLTPNLLEDMAFLESGSVLVTDDSADWLRKLDDARAMEDTARKGRDMVLRRFSEDAMARGYVALYERLRRER